MKRIRIFIPLLLLIGIISFQLQAQENKKNGDVYNVAEEKPEYPGGEAALIKDIAEAIKYPEEAKKNGISGKIYVSFVVDENGKVTDAKIERGVDPSLDKESLRVVGLLKTWKPGKDGGKAVKVAYTLPINFALDNKPKTKEE